MYQALGYTHIMSFNIHNFMRYCYYSHLINRNPETKNVPSLEWSSQDLNLSLSDSKTHAAWDPNPILILKSNY